MGTKFSVEDTLSSMQVHILGLGSIGQLIAHNLRRVLPSTHDITLVYKTQRRAKDFLLRGAVVNVERDGITSSSKGFRYGVYNSLVSLPTVAVESEGGVSSAGDVGLPKDQIESLIVTTKAQQVLPAIQTLLPHLSSDATIVLMQNGLGVYENLIHDVFRNVQRRPHFILASNTHGAYMKGESTTVHAGIGTIQFGIVPDPSGRDFEAGFHDENVSKLERHLRLTDIESPVDDPAGQRYRSLRTTVSALLRMEQLNVSWKPISEVQSVMRQKLVVNAVINPLTAIMNCRNGDIFASASTRRIMRWVCQEAAKVLAAQQLSETGNWLDDLSKQGVDPDTVDVGRMPPDLSAENLEDQVLQVAHDTKGNISSMLSDVRKGRFTEVHYITGYLLKLGRAYRINMPCTAMLHELVKARGHIPIDQML